MAHPPPPAPPLHTSTLLQRAAAPPLLLPLPQAVYVPADDLTDPAPATTFAHLDATTVLSRSIAELGIYPAVDPLDSTRCHDTATTTSTASGWEQISIRPEVCLNEPRVAGGPGLHQ